MEALNPKSKTFLEPFILKPLYDYAMTIPNVSRIMLEKNADFDVLGAQCKVHKNVILQNIEHVESIDIMDVLRFLHKDFTATAFILIMLYRVVITCGYGSSRVECLFSAMAHIDTPKRRSQSPYRECNLTYIYFECEKVKAITFQEFET